MAPEAAAEPFEAVLAACDGEVDDDAEGGAKNQMEQRRDRFLPPKGKDSGGTVRGWVIRTCPEASWPLVLKYQAEMEEKDR